MVDFCDTLVNGFDVPRLKYLAGRVLLLFGKDILLRLVVRFLERVMAAAAAATGAAQR